MKHDLVDMDTWEGKLFAMHLALAHIDYALGNNDIADAKQQIAALQNFIQAIAEEIKNED